MPSFDIVSKLNEVELRHAVENAIREMNTRFDFKNVDCEIELNDLTVSLKAESEFQVHQLEELVVNHCTKRHVSLVGMKSDDKPLHSGKTYRLNMVFKQGIESVEAKNIVKFIKDHKLKVQTAIQGDHVRITGKKRDDLQTVIAKLKEKTPVDIALQFENFRD